jgi:hypothetical protein
MVTLRFIGSADLKLDRELLYGEEVVALFEGWLVKDG